MGLDMYLNKVKKNKIFEDKTMIAVAGELYEKNDKNKEFFKPFEDAGLTYTYTRWKHCGEQTYLEKNVAYWRKANEIHKWIYENCAEEGQRDYDCIIVEKEKIEELIKVCRDVLNDLETCPKETKKVECGWSSKNGTEYRDIITYKSSVAEDLLPTQSGFFFGSTDIYEWYIEDVKYSLELFKEAIKLFEKGYILKYDASW